MRLVLALALALAAAPLTACKKSTTAGPDQPKPSAITLPPARPTVGARWTELDEISIEAEVRRGGRSAWLGSKMRHRTTTEVLEVDAAGVVTRVAVSYLEREDQDSGPGPDAPLPKRSVIAGRSYVVGLVDGRVAAARADGTPIGDAELREIADDQSELGKPSVMDEIMARTWQVGVKVDVTADQLRRLTEGARADAPRVTAASYTLREVRGDEAELAIRQRMVRSGQVSMTIDSTGRLLIDVRTGWPKRFSLSGAVNGSAAGVPFSGNMKESFELTPD